MYGMFTAIRKISILLAIFFPFLTQAQVNFCGTEQNVEQMQWLREFQHSYSPSGVRSGETYYVPIKIHVVGTDDGAGYLGVGTIIQNMCDLNAQFEPTGFVFYLDGDLDYISNTSYYTHDWYSGYAMMAENNVSGAVNMYYVEDPAGNCGYFSYSGDAVAIAKSCGGIGNTTIAHELGHFFSLPHTFYGWEYGTPSIDDQETVDGSNCESAGDGFCDTPPDYASYRWYCSSPPVFTDPNGAEFTPDGTNMMSYADDPCMVQFQEDQQAAMQANLTGPRNYLLSGDAPVYVDLDSATLSEPADGAAGLYPNHVELKWNAVPGATYYEVTIALNMAFTALANSFLVSDTSILLTELASERKYYWKVRPVGALNYCETYSGAWSFTTGFELLSDVEAHIESQNTMRIYPNPAQPDVPVTISVNSESRIEGEIILMHVNGEKVLTRRVDTNTGNGNFTLQLPQLVSGIYVVMLKENSGAITVEKLILN